MAGIYIHIPFCKQKCSYCDFHFSTRFSSYRDEMIQAITTELEQRRSYLEDKMIKTIYLGGGTPSLLSTDELVLLLQTITDHFEVAKDVEITLEANPDDITSEVLSRWKAHGINRLSIGLQSFREQDLTWMNRAHSAEEAIACVALVKQRGFSNFTVDLIYGLPDMSTEEWLKNVQQVIDFGVPHVSAYCLTVEQKTALHHWVRRGKITPASEEQQSEEFHVLVDRLEAAGLEQYEISNFSKPGYESKHNSNYWKGEWYLGVGPSAHSFNGTSRQWNIANNAVYMKSVRDGNSYSETEELTKEDQFNEYVMTGLRTVYGIDQAHLASILPITDTFKREYQSFIQQGWMTEENGVLRLTREGRLRADFIASELFMVS